MSCCHTFSEKLKWPSDLVTWWPLQFFKTYTMKFISCVVVKMSCCHHFQKDVSWPRDRGTEGPGDVVTPKIYFCLIYTHWRRSLNKTLTMKSWQNIYDEIYFLCCCQNVMLSLFSEKLKWPSDRVTWFCLKYIFAEKMTKFHEFPHMFATRGKPRVEIPYENRKKLRVGKKTWSPKTHENRKKMTKFHYITVFFLRRELWHFVKKSLKSYLLYKIK